MNIAVIAPPRLPVPPIRGGAIEMHIFQVTQRLPQHNLTVYSVSDPELPNTEHFHNLNFTRVGTTRARGFVSDWLLSLGSTQIERAFYYQRYLRFIIRYLNERRPEIVHVHNTFYFVPFLRRELRHRTKIILHMNNSHLVRRRTCFGLEAIGGSDLIIACSRFIEDEILTHFPQAQGKTAVVHNGVNVDQFASSLRETPAVAGLRDHHRVPRGSPVVGFTGRLVPEKGVHMLLRAAPLVVQRLKRPVTFLIAGGPWPPKRGEAYGKQIQALAAQAQAAGAIIRFIGFVNPFDMPMIYAMMDVFIAPGLWKEPFGMVYAEAGASMLPVIASSRGAVSELIVDGESGILIDDPEDPELLTSALLSILRDHSVAKRYGENLCKRIRRSFSWDCIAAETDACYQQFK